MSKTIFAMVALLSTISMSCWGQSNSVIIEFINPNQYTDFTTGQLHEPAGKNSLMSELRMHIEQKCAPSLKNGNYLLIQMRDVDLAGREVAGRARVDNPLYPPKLVFDYRFMDADGNVLKSGSEVLIGQNRLQLASMANQYRTRGLALEKALFDQWLTTLKTADI